ncbi:MAG TPA: 3-deoxy-7-phosphoheptulonate synthase, partial [Marinobacter sp.]|nr:3-deoxy-7-phosphoheptulonate synthase [Marinobacter sp.]
GPQALLMNELPAYLEDIRLCHDTWKKRQAIYQRLRGETPQ